MPADCIRPNPAKAKYQHQSWSNALARSTAKRDRRRRCGYGNISQAAVNQGIQDGLYTGSRDAQRGQSYNPQRSHFYKNGHGDNGGYGRYGNSYQYQQAYRQGFVRGYDQGFRQYGGYNNRGRNTNNRFPFPW